MDEVVRFEIRLMGVEVGCLKNGQGRFYYANIRKTHLVTGKPVPFLGGAGCSEAKNKAEPESRHVLDVVLEFDSVGEELPRVEGKTLRAQRMEFSNF